MTSMVPHAFEDYLMRSFEREDGKLCFIAKDVCACLEIKNPWDALTPLDNDEKGLVLTETLGGPQEVNYVTESGLYTLILRSRKAVTPGTVQHRFRKWVTDDLLPTLRTKGRYEMPGQGAFEPADDSLSVKLALVREVRLTFGREQAQAIWHQIGLPYFETPRHVPEGMDEHPVDEFIAACIMTARGNLVSSADFRTAYADWAAAHGKPDLNMTVIGRRVKLAGIRKIRPGGDSRHYYYTDIALVVGGAQ